MAKAAKAGEPDMYAPVAAIAKEFEVMNNPKKRLSGILIMV